MKVDAPVGSIERAYQVACHFVCLNLVSLRMQMRNKYPALSIEQINDAIKSAANELGRR